MRISRRRFLQTASVAATTVASAGATAAWAGLSGPAGGVTAQASSLARRFRDLSRHFVFEYYAWYGMNPVEHWDQDGRRPPVDLASNFMPRLGAYDSSSTRVMEQHARWMRESGAGAINLSWWGRGSSVDKLVPALMDVMAAHDLKVTFHLEPYNDRHVRAYADDVEYLIREYGERRRWDCFLLLQNESGARGPVFKSFRTIVPAAETDCHGVSNAVADHAADDVWREQTDRVRAQFAKDFDHVTLLADSLDWQRTVRSGFDGIAIYDNYVEPRLWPDAATACTEHGLLFSFSVNPGFDGIARRSVEPNSCYAAPAIEPPLDRPYQWSDSRSLDAARRSSERRIAESFDRTTALQTDPRLTNRARGFFLAYINSFNEWHEGHQFEPMKNRRDLTRDERAVGYHNSDDGEYRLRTLKRHLKGVTG